MKASVFSTFVAADEQVDKEQRVADALVGSRLAGLLALTACCMQSPSQES